jgi:L-threonylcarbamoyladenylate synthase
MKEFKINPDNPQPEMIKIAAKVLEIGGLVAYPTETVYGIGANILDPNAVQRIFEVKRRPEGKPSSIAFKDVKSAKKYVYFTPQAKKLAEKFLPGPLTIILSTRLSVSDFLGGSKVGVRIPSNRVAQTLLGMVKFPITSTSANISGRESASTAEEVIEQIGSKVDVLLDAGKCELSQPSTVVDLSENRIEILRDGAIPKSEIEKLLGD